MPDLTTQVTAAEISRLAGVTRATVSNWRRRHPDFPSPVGGTDTSPTYALESVREWLSGRGQLPEATPEAELRIALRGALDGRALALRLLSLVPPLVNLPPKGLAQLAGLSDETFGAELAAALPDPDGALSTVPGPAIRVLLRCLDARGAETALRVIAEHLTDAVATGTEPTPAGLADLLVALPERVDRVLDPACGGGALLAAAARAGASCVLGQEIAADQAELARVRAEISTPHAEVCPGDSLRVDAFPDERVDAVVCVPPFGTRDWGHDELAYDPRWVHGLPPRSESELAWVQHCLAHLRADGTAVVVMPPGAAERSSGRRIRAELVRSGALRAVIALPQGAAPPLHVSLQLWLLAPPPSADPRPVLFVDASTEPGRGREIDWKSVSERVLTAWRAFREDPDGVEPEHGRTRTRPVVDLLDGTVDLTPQRHVRAATVLDPGRHEARTSELRERLRDAGHALVGLSDEQLWRTAGSEPAAWRTATVADLLRGGALTLHRATLARGVAPPAPDQPPTVLTHHDVRAGAPPSGSLRDVPVEELVPIEPGDVLLPEALHHAGPVVAHVARDGEAGSVLGPHLFLLRPDSERLDSDFLAGFLSAEQNIHGAAAGTSIQRIDVKRLRVPLIPMERQKLYGQAFRRVRATHSAASLAANTARELADQWELGLTSGALLPPGGGP